MIPKKKPARNLLTTHLSLNVELLDAHLGEAVYFLVDQFSDHCSTVDGSGDYGSGFEEALFFTSDSCGPGFFCAGEGFTAYQ